MYRYSDTTLYFYDDEIDESDLLEISHYNYANEMSRLILSNQYSEIELHLHKSQLIKLKDYIEKMLKENN
jgi:hypothetical protein